MTSQHLYYFPLAARMCELRGLTRLVNLIGCAWADLELNPYQVSL